MLISLNYEGNSRRGEEHTFTAARRSSRPECQPRPKSHQYGDNASKGLPQMADTVPRLPASSGSMVSVEEALRIIKDHTPAPVATDVKVTSSIIGSIIAEDVRAPSMVPEFRSSGVDGYAVVVEEGKPMKKLFRTGYTTGGGCGGLAPLHPAAMVKVAVGDVLPSNANAVISVEHITHHGREKEYVEILTNDFMVGKNVRQPGHLITLGSRLFARGDHISAASGATGLLALAGIRTIKVFRKPRVGILSMADGITTHFDQNPDVGYLALVSVLSSWGFATVDLGMTHNTPGGELRHALLSSDVILIMKDASPSRLDLKPTIDCLGGTFHFDCVSLKPGSETSFATVPANVAERCPPGQSPKLVFSLPSEIQSALVALHVFVLPSLHDLSGLGRLSHAAAAKPWIAPQLGLPRVAVVLTHQFPLDLKHTNYHLGVVTASRSDARLYATSVSVGPVDVRGSRSNHGAEVNALIILRAGRGVGIKGEIVEALLMGPIPGSDTRLIC
ncbi:unnamed protein product [Penicillium salamii]|uniref:MoeA N-terminal and linker domain-containing protein n=1 Tax=Penicillium salamii TaxID=1612424 RepID=A0A9W4JGH7_9EURO|nr:unnamed protein product [Penicillium salamii]CAG8141685.1 unnamed protein product [Penicillium salamii]CAG8141941.1 unnamed protein product [Penicillium salamii]CAG8163053.1 unnamed protein product [Penicillium salamii]CAG8169570.1 unnamed protein product [Penicillium salamii]